MKILCKSTFQFWTIYNRQIKVSTESGSKVLFPSVTARKAFHVTHVEPTGQQPPLQGLHLRVVQQGFQIRSSEGLGDRRHVLKVHVLCQS